MWPRPRLMSLPVPQTMAGWSPMTMRGSGSWSPDSGFSSRPWWCWRPSDGFELPLVAAMSLDHMNLNHHVRDVNFLQACRGLHLDEIKLSSSERLSTPTLVRTSLKVNAAS